MRTFVLLGMLVVCGCDQVFMLDRSEVPAGDECWDLSLQGNEDNDAYLDGCDLCPADVDAAEIANVDADGLADACDPRATEASQLVTFDGFDVLEGWTSSSNPSTWQITGGELEQTDPIGVARIERPIPGTLRPGADVTFELGIGLIASAGVLFDLGQFEIECSMEARTNGNDDRFALRINGAVMAETVVIGGGLVRIQLFLDAQGVATCRGRRGAASFAEITASSPPAQTSAKVLLQTNAATARFEYLTVFSTP